MMLTLADWLRNALGGNIAPDPEPPGLDALARKYARRIMAEGMDLRHPSAEDMITWRIKAAIIEDRQARRRP